MNTTSHAGLKMVWVCHRGHMYNAANPYTITGYIDGVCRMSHAISSQTARSFEQMEKRVKSRLEEIAKEKK